MEERCELNEGWTRIIYVGVLPPTPSEINNHEHGRYTCSCQQGSQQSAYLQSLMGSDYGSMKQGSQLPVLLQMFSNVELMILN